MMSAATKGDASVNAVVMCVSQAQGVVTSRTKSPNNDFLVINFFLLVNPVQNAAPLAIG
jgi:hypothetical protein